MCLFVAKNSLEDEPEGEFHLPPSLLARILSKIVRVIKVAIRERTIHVIQHVVSREAKLNIESLADRADREILIERRIPVKLLPSVEDVAAERANVGESGSGDSIANRRIPGKNSRS